MRPPDHFIEIEPVIGHGLRPLMSELRLIDLPYLADHVLNGQTGCLRDVIEGAAETHYAPGFIHFDGDADIVLDWHGAPAVSVAIVLSDGALDARVRLVLKPQSASISLELLDVPCAGQTVPDDLAARVARTLSRNCLTPS